MDSNHDINYTRSYQQEMFERTLKGNAIVMMDTGSGKTHVAVLRIQWELDKCPASKRVWFLAPTVELCLQQHRVLSAAIPAHETLVLTGSDNVDRWSEQRVWDAALDQVRIVVSTHAVLADALRHGFVRISNLALLVYDEAHHCVKNHPANAIMRDFYHPTKASQGRSSVPHILGLSATLIMGSNLGSMNTIENNLDSVGITPRIHRDDLLKHVHRPTCQLLNCDSSDDQLLYSARLKALKMSCRDFNLMYALRNLSLQFDSHRAGLGESLSQDGLKKTDKAIRTFIRKAEFVCESLGTWAADYFINATIKALKARTNDEDDIFMDLDEPHQQILMALFNQSDLLPAVQDQPPPADFNISSKVKCLISFLLEENENEPVGIVFVEQRVTTSVLSMLLTLHPATRDKLRCVPFVGTSNVTARRYGLTELVDMKAQKETVSKFRDGNINLIVATNALEEGIDVQSCNIVACFDPPTNLKSFVQRRGRARHMRSKLGIIMTPERDSEMVDRWSWLERQLTAICQDDDRQVTNASNLEAPEENVNYVLEVPSTGAKLTAHDTLSHLYHFCGQLRHDAYVDPRPVFTYTEGHTGRIKATVSLPSTLATQVRRASSQRRWKTERAARKDAAFQAYLALYNAELLNQNLLPLSHEWDLGEDVRQDGTPAGQVDVPAQMDVWSSGATKGKYPDWHTTAVVITAPEKLRESNERDVNIVLTTRHRLVSVPPRALTWASGVKFEVAYMPSLAVSPPSDHDLRLSQESTSLVYRSVRSEKYPLCNTNYAVHFQPHLESGGLAQWLDVHSRQSRASSLLGTAPKSLVRVPFEYRPAFMFRGWSSVDGEMKVRCEQFPRRRNFLSPGAASTNRSKSASQSNEMERDRTSTFPIEDCTFDNLPLPLARVGLFMQAILQHIEEWTIASALQSKVLHDIRFKKQKHLLVALCAPSAARQSNYQRYEFIGDSVLKYVVSWHLFATQPNWHEDFLSIKRSRVVSNSALAETAISHNLPHYIITETIPYKEWTLPVVDESQDGEEKKRRMSSKVLADVVEALIGAAWIDSGMPAAMACIRLFIPSVTSTRIKFGQSTQPEQNSFASADVVESLVGHTFKDRTLLLEALTHPSCGPNIKSNSYQRLEFLGDAVLDMIVAKHLASQVQRLSQGRMTHIKAALVNAHLLGFLCLDLRRQVGRRAVETKVIAGVPETSETAAVSKTNLASYMRSQSLELAAARKACQQRYAQHEAVIHKELRSGKKYPWIELAQLRPEKFNSDIVESMLGAIFVDTQGDLDVCAAFVRKLGLLTYMERLMDESVDVLHPRDRTQQVAGARSVKYDVKRCADGRYRCAVLLDDAPLVVVDECLDREEALVLAAIRAGDLIRTETGESAGRC